MRVLYVARLNEGELKGDVEASMNNHFRTISDEPFHGLKIILGIYSIHLVEGESSSVKKLLKNINSNMQSATPFYNQVWIIHQVDEVPSKIFN